MIHNQAMLTVRIPRAGTRGIIEGHEIRALRGGDGTTHLPIRICSIRASYPLMGIFLPA